MMMRMMRMMEGGVILISLFGLFFCSIGGFRSCQSSRIKHTFNSSPLKSFRENGALDKERLVILSGATGTLGCAIHKEFLQSSHNRLLLSYRPTSCQKTDLQKQPMFNPIISNDLEIWFPLEVSTFEEKWLWDQIGSSSLFALSEMSSKTVPTSFLPSSQPSLLSLPNFSKYFLSAGSYHPIKQLVLINNAAICEKGRSFDTFHKTLALNTLLPIWLTAQLLEQVIACPSHSLEEVVIINVSSGDGEKVFIDSDLIADIYPDDYRSFQQSQRKHVHCDNLLNFQQYISQRLSSIFKDSPIANNNSQHMKREIAVGHTPSYSLSKALLNRFTQLLAQEIFEFNMHSHGIQYRVHSICPGNFASPMSTQEELSLFIPPGQHQVRNVDDAAKDILSMIQNKEKTYKSGGFYRYCEPISV